MEVLGFSIGKTWKNVEKYGSFLEKPLNQTESMIPLYTVSYSCDESWMIPRVEER